MLVQISNIFNLLTQQQNSGFEFYHYGYRYDINREVDNNFNIGHQIGRRYPSVQMDVPDNFTSQKLEDFTHEGKFTIPIRLYFDDLLDYDNLGQTTILNEIEVQENLRRKASVFVQSFIKVIDESIEDYFSSDSPVVFTPRTNLTADRAITIECTFNLVAFDKCLEPSDYIIISPIQVINEDIERVGR